MISILYGAILSFFLPLLLSGAALADGRQTELDMRFLQSRPEVPGATTQPRRHKREGQPQRLSAEKAQEIYETLCPERVRSVRAAAKVGAESFTGWQQYNSAPYLSQAHGNTYVNNYVNEIGRAYGRYEEAGILPVGSMIVKDSFVVHSDGSYALGQLVVMEKMPSGFNRVSGDWRYSAISPGGEVLGITRGPNADQVAYCVPCHLARERTDHLFFLPDSFRRPME